MLVALHTTRGLLFYLCNFLLVFVSFMQNFIEIPSFFQFSVLLKGFFFNWGGVVCLFVGFVIFYFGLVGFFWAFFFFGPEDYQILSVFPGVFSPSSDRIMPLLL